MNVKIVKFINGEEVLGEIVSSGEFLILKNVVSIMIMQPQRPGDKASIGFTPYMPYSTSKTFEFNAASVMVTATPVDEMLNEYNRMFGAGIIIAKQPLANYK